MAKLTKEESKQKEAGPREEKEETEQKKVEAKEEKEEEEEEKSFGELGLDPRLVRALSKKRIEKPTPIQTVAIPLILVSPYAVI